MYKQYKKRMHCRLHMHIAIENINEKKKQKKNNNKNKLMFKMYVFDDWVQENMCVAIAYLCLRVYFTC